MKILCSCLRGLVERGKKEMICLPIIKQQKLVVTQFEWALRSCDRDSLPESSPSRDLTLRRLDESAEWWTKLNKEHSCTHSGLAAIASHPLCAPRQLPWCFHRSAFLFVGSAVQRAWAAGRTRCVTFPPVVTAKSSFALKRLYLFQCMPY